VDILFALPLSIGLLAAWFIKLKLLFSHKGFDPALITYADPLAIFYHIGYRAILATALVLSLQTSVPSELIKLLCLLVFISSITHAVILFVFNRQATQPIGYYVFLSVAALSLSFSPHDSWKWSLNIWFAGELWLFYWHKTQQSRYNKWVASLARTIDKKYRHFAKSMPANDWQWVLHVAVTESIARPKIVRQAERLYFRIKRPEFISTGIMQIRDNHPISDEESMKRGAAIIHRLLPHMPDGISLEHKLVWLARHYNGSSSYTQYLTATLPGLALFHSTSKAMDVSSRR